MLEVLREKVTANNFAKQCDLHIEDVFNLSFPSDTFDFAVCLHVIPRFLTDEDQRAALQQIIRIIKPGGRLLFNYRNAHSFYGLIYKGHASSTGRMRKLFDELGLEVEVKRGKWFLTRKLINALPMPLGRCVAFVDSLMLRVMPYWAWDVFLIVKKTDNPVDT